GSFDFMDSWCHSTEFTKPRHGSTFIYLESLRRNVPDSYPFWFPLDPSWEKTLLQQALPQDSRVVITFAPMDAPGGTSDMALLRFILKPSSPLRAFSLVLDSDGQVLQVPFLVHIQCPAPLGVWDDFSWYDSFNMCHCHRHNLDGVGVFVMPPASLITGGKYIVSRGVPQDDEFADVIPPGEYPIVTQARLPRGTPA